jgi:hypothetical protein
MLPEPPLKTWRFLVLKLEKDLEELVRRFDREAEVTSHESRVIAREGEPYVWFQDLYSVGFRNLQVDLYETITYKLGVGWLSSLISMLKGSTGLMHVVILSTSRSLQTAPKLIYLDRHETGLESITAEWYIRDIDTEERMKGRQSRGYTLIKTIRFEEVVEEARKLLTEKFKD